MEAEIAQRRLHKQYSFSLFRLETGTPQRLTPRLKEAAAMVVGQGAI
jgi:hypothetical protein